MANLSSIHNLFIQGEMQLALNPEKSSGPNDGAVNDEALFTKVVSPCNIGKTL